MQILLASAKIMNSAEMLTQQTKKRKEGKDVMGNVPMVSVPRFEAEAVRMAEELSRWSTEEIAKEMGCSVQIAAENRLRYGSFMSEEEKLPAVLAYYGQAYKYLKAAEMTAGDLRFAQKHLLITSFLYGLLRPLDRIHPYRMEGKVCLEATGDRTMFEFWKERLTDVLIEEVKKDDGVLVHLATEEMEHLFDWKRVKEEVKVVQPVFVADQGGRMKVVAVHAKSCRGAMTRMIIKERMKTVKGLWGFEMDGYEYRGGERFVREMGPA
ncbi:MAG: YaaA family protein [Prevotella sp.]|nr:YaaA family protein [Prevotella sp.]